MATRWRGSATGGGVQSAPPSVAPEFGSANHAGPGTATPVTLGRSFEDAMNEANARGPGYGVAADGNGGYRVVVTDQNLVREGGLPGGAPPPTLPTDPMANQPAAPLSPAQALGRARGLVPAFEASVAPRPAVGRTVTSNRMPGEQQFAGMDMGGATPGQPPAAEQGPAEVDRARIDALLGNVSKATGGLMSLGQRDLQFSQAQAQLRQGLDMGQRQALATARSGSRRDRAANESRAIQAGTELAAQTGQAAAGLRATEEAAQQQIRLDAYKAAGDLGLNAGALDLNVQQLDMNAATNYLNQLFARENLNLQIDQQEAERITNFVRDMALIEKDYYALSQAERDAVRQDLTRRYGISEQSRIAMSTLDKSDDINWGQLAISGIGGLITGSAQVGAALATKSATGGAA